jgi:hypothetical protein
MDMRNHHDPDEFRDMMERDCDPGDMDGDATSALASAGFGTDEDYGDYGYHEDY